MSNLDQVNEIVAQGYDQVFQTYAGLEADDSWPRMRWISKLRVKLQEGAAILDLGCGSGVPADLILSEDFAVSVVDISPKQIELARQKVPNATFEVGDADSAHFDEGLFSAILSFYTLEQIPRQQHGALFAKIFAWLAPGGYLLFSMEAGDIEGSRFRVVGVSDVL